MTGGTFPGGISLSRLDVYDSVSIDGVCGGSPHLHLVSTEAYVVVGGTGALQTIDASGFAEPPLEAGSVVWFTPGTIHRAINRGELRVVVLMSNAGLPEAGDAVMTFPAEHLVDAEAYERAASLDAEGVAGLDSTTAERAEQRRDLAVRGFGELRDAVLRGDRGPLEAFHAAAGRIVAQRGASWERLIRSGPLAQAERSLVMARAVIDGDVDHLREARTFQAVGAPGERGFGMCGRLRTYDLAPS